MFFDQWLVIQDFGRQEKKVRVLEREREKAHDGDGDGEREMVFQTVALNFPLFKFKILSPLKGKNKETYRCFLFLTAVLAL